MPTIDAARVLASIVFMRWRMASIVLSHVVFCVSKRCRTCRKRCRHADEHRFPHRRPPPPMLAVLAFSLDDRRRTCRQSLRFPLAPPAAHAGSPRVFPWRPPPHMPAVIALSLGAPRRPALADPTLPRERTSLPVLPNAIPAPAHDPGKRRRPRLRVGRWPRRRRGRDQAAPSRASSFSNSRRSRLPSLAGSRSVICGKMVR